MADAPATPDPAAHGDTPPAASRPEPAPVQRWRRLCDTAQLAAWTIAIVAAVALVAALVGVIVGGQVNEVGDCSSLSSGSCQEVVYQYRPLALLGGALVVLVALPGYVSCRAVERWALTHLES